MIEIEEGVSMIIAFTGAGISAESGIPTFSEQPGIRDKLTRTFARTHHDEYSKVITGMMEACDKAEPNDAHKALAEYDIPILTMNIDGLHTDAGSKVVIPLHGEFPNIVLYDDPAPNYKIAYDWVGRMRPEPEKDLLIFIGTSFYTNISNEIRRYANIFGVKTIIINKDAGRLVRKTLENFKDYIEPYDEFIKRPIYF